MDFIPQYLVDRISNGKTVSLDEMLKQISRAIANEKEYYQAGVQYDDTEMEEEEDSSSSSCSVASNNSIDDSGYDSSMRQPIAKKQASSVVNRGSLSAGKTSVLIPSVIKIEDD